MIIECTTLEQVKDVIRINNIKEAWDDFTLKENLKEICPLCIRIREGFGYDERRFYESEYPDLQIVSYEEYIKTINPSKINLRHAIWNTTLIVQCLHCEPFESVEKDGMFIDSHTRNFIVIAKDGIVLSEGEVGTYKFSTHQEAQDYLGKLLELVKMVNKSIPVVDLSKVGSCKIENMTYITIGDTFITLVKNGKCIAEFSKKQLPLPIIQSQLTTILDHLGIKAEVII